MGKVFAEISADLSRWLMKQHVFFVATAPNAADGYINCSPKGMDTFRVIDPLTVAYQDFVGSGVETIAHLKENRRIVIMFCAFEGSPRIVRLQGHGEVVLPGNPDFEQLAQAFDEKPGVRACIRLALTRISDSCGYGVPRMDFVSERSTLIEWVDNKGPDGIQKYIREKNSQSIDGLPGICDSP